MKVTFFIGGLTNGGAERVVCELANHFVKKGVDVVIVVFNSTVSDYSVDKRVEIKPLIQSANSSRIIKVLEIYLGLMRYTKTHKTDCYITFLPVNIFLLMSCRRNIKVPIIVSERNWPKAYPVIARYIMKHCMKYAKGSVFLTKEARECYYSNKDNSQNTEIIPNAVNKEISSYKAHKDKKNIIVSVGRLSKQKNHQLTINAFKKISEKHSDWRLIIYGEGSERKNIEKLIDNLGLNSSVELKGKLVGMPKYLSEAEIFVNSSDYEGMPNALIEAMSLGLPCISSNFDGGAAKELIINDENGLLFEKGNVDELQEAMEKLISNKDYRYKLGEQAKEINSRLDAGVVYDKWLTFVYKVLENQ